MARIRLKEEWAKIEPLVPADETVDFDLESDSRDNTKPVSPFHKRFQHLWPSQWISPGTPRRQRKGGKCRRTPEPHTNLLVLGWRRFKLLSINGISANLTCVAHDYRPSHP